MSILIKGMEMPKSCSSCPMLEGYDDDGLCHAVGRWLDDDEVWEWDVYPEGDVDLSRPSNCPLVPVPPHGRLIDADALFPMYADLLDGRDVQPVIPKIVIDTAPTIIEAEGE